MIYCLIEQVVSVDENKKNFTVIDHTHPYLIQVLSLKQEKNFYFENKIVISTYSFSENNSFEMNCD